MFNSKYQIEDVFSNKTDVRANPLQHFGVKSLKRKVDYQALYQKQFVNYILIRMRRNGNVSMPLKVQ